MIKKVYLFYMECKTKEDERKLREVCEKYNLELAFLHNNKEGNMIFEITCYDSRYEEVVSQVVARL